MSLRISFALFIVLSATAAFADDPFCIALTRNGRQLNFVEISSQKLEIETSHGAIIEISSDMISEIKKFDDREEWFIIPTNGNPFSGILQGDLQGTISFGTYEISLKDIVSLVFSGKSPSGDLYDDPSDIYAAAITFVDGSHFKAKTIKNSRLLYASHPNHGTSGHSWTRKLLCLQSGSYSSLVDLRNIAAIDIRQTIAYVELKNGQKITGELSEAERFEAQTVWGKIDFPHSSIKEFSITEDIYWDMERLLNWQEWAIEAVYNHHSFNGKFVLENGTNLAVESLMIEYACNWGSRFGAGIRYFFASNGIPCMFEANRIDLKPEMIRRLTIETINKQNDGGIVLSITGVDGMVIDAELLQGYVERYLGQYYAANGSNEYVPLAFWGMTDYGFIRIGTDFLKMIVAD